MSTTVERIELYVDGDTRPARTITGPPFRATLDTRELADGRHTVRVVTVFDGGGRDERELSFEVDNVPAVVLEGLADGDVVRGTVDLEVRAAAPLAAAPPHRSAAVYFASIVVALGAVWALFALTPPVGVLFAAGTAAKGAEKTPVNQALYEEGKHTFATYCASCHQANGKGVDDSFPPLAGNANLKDLGLVVKTVRTGKQGHVVIEGKSFNSAMPPIGAGLTPKQVAEIATYIRNSWGNDFGGVTVEQVQQHLAGGGQ